MTKTAVVILNWNGEKFLEQFMPSVTTNTTAPNTEIWVADNGSTDNSIKFLQQNYPNVHTLLFDKNYGFTGGYNRALAKIEAEYFVLLNSDIEVAPNWLEPLVNYMDNNHNVAASMPKILQFADKTKFEYAGAAGGFIDCYGFPFCRGRVLSNVETDNGQYNDVSDIFWATGACLMIRSDLFRKSGGLDEDFFAHMEEIDLCWRLKNMGHRIVVVPQSVVYHVGGGTLPNNSPRKLFLNYRNCLWMMYKNLPTKKFHRTLFMRMVLDGLSACMYLVKLQFSFFWAVPRAHFAFYSELKNLRAKRADLKANRTIFTIHPEVLKHSFVLKVYLGGKKTFADLMK